MAAPLSIEGAAAWEAAKSCVTVALGYGVGDARLDMGAAMAVATAAGCARDAAALLLSSIQDGLKRAQARHREKAKSA